MNVFCRVGEITHPKHSKIIFRLVVATEWKDSLWSRGSDMVAQFSWLSNSVRLQETVSNVTMLLQNSDARRIESNVCLCVCLEFVSRSELNPIDFPLCI